ncbi:PREDICTED: LOC110769081 isoform X2, partial [Prunus dulcis]
EAQTSNKPRKGQWFYFYKGDMIQHQCRECLKQDHAATFCPYRNYVPKGAKVGPVTMVMMTG